MILFCKISMGPLGWISTYKLCFFLKHCSQQWPLAGHWQGTSEQEADFLGLFVFDSLINSRAVFFLYWPRVPYLGLAWWEPSVTWFYIACKICTRYTFKENKKDQTYIYGGTKLSDIGVNPLTATTPLSIGVALALFWDRVLLDFLWFGNLPSFLIRNIRRMAVWLAHGFEYITDMR